MLFRYKITECVYDSFDRLHHGYAVRYGVKIQYLKPNAKIFKWRTFKDERLCCILDSLGHAEKGMYFLENFKQVLKQHKDMNEIMFKYIKQEMQNRNITDEKIKLENEMDNLILTNGWNTIEIKENE